jgi:uncharacterized protein (TIGR02757 family)
MINPLELQRIKILLDKKAELYNRSEFIETDPIQVPHRYIKKEDIEIAGFLASTIAWGQRISIIKSASRLLQLMDNSPYEFVVSASEKDLGVFRNFVHRTFQDKDCIFFIRSLRHIYKHSGGLENLFSNGFINHPTFTIKEALINFHQVFFALSHLSRTRKHVADVAKNASAKRLNMFLRWMVRKDLNGVDFGIWQHISPSVLMLPLDIHTGTAARRLGLLTRKQNDWQSVEEVTANLRHFDENDPVKYDFALFGMDIFEL